jgi:hypothetical protein
MSTKADYSAEEWNLLVQVPAYVGYGVLIAEPSGWRGTKQEIAALRAAADQLVKEYGSPLNDALAPDVRALLASDELEKRSRDKNVDAILDSIAQHCADAIKLLSRRSTPDEVYAYQAFVYEMGVMVAQAAVDAEFLGIGGERVSARERKALKRLRDALGMRNEE